MDLVTLDGITYIAVSAGVTPQVPTGITLTEVLAGDPVRERIKAEAPYCKLIYERMQAKIREKYCAEDEMYLTRISVGALSGRYVFQPGEEVSIVEYQAFIEGVRQWGRDERAAVGL